MFTRIIPLLIILFAICGNAGAQAVSANNKNISVYPSPAKSYIEIAPDFVEDGTFFQLTITDLIGNIVYKSTVLYHSQPIRIDFSSNPLANGLYLIRIDYDKNVTIKRFWVKN